MLGRVAPSPLLLRGVRVMFGSAAELRRMRHGFASSDRPIGTILWVFTHGALRLPGGLSSEGLDADRHIVGTWVIMINIPSIHI